jgi:hypothetical protein
VTPVHYGLGLRLLLVDGVGVSQRVVSILGACGRKATEGTVMSKNVVCVFKTAKTHGDVAPGAEEMKITGHSFLLVLRLHGSL